MNLEVIMMSEISDGERQTPCNFTYLKNLKIKRNKNKNHRYWEQSDGFQRGVTAGEWVHWIRGSIDTNSIYKVSKP